jgi:hypothetical protein
LVYAKNVNYLFSDKSAFLSALVQRLRQALDHFIKFRRVLDGQFGEHFAVNYDVLFFHYSGKPAPGGAVFTESRVGSNKPQGAEVAFSVPAVAVSVSIGFKQSLPGGNKISGAAVVKTFGSFKYIFSALAGGNAAFDSCHISILSF